MAIDVKAEAEKIAERTMNRGSAVSEGNSTLGKELENRAKAATEIVSIVTRAVADAKREQMALVLAEITRLRDQYPTDVFGDGTAPDASLDSKSAFMARKTCHNLEREIKEAINDAETEPRDIGKEIVTDLTAMCKEQATRKLCAEASILADKVGCLWENDGKYRDSCLCTSCSVVRTARELGLDGDA